MVYERYINLFIGSMIDIYIYIYYIYIDIIYNYL